MNITITTTEQKEIQLPYFTKSEGGCYYAQTKENICICVDHNSIRLYNFENGCEFPEISANEFYREFDRAVLFLTEQFKLN